MSYKRVSRAMPTISSWLLLLQMATMSSAFSLPGNYNNNNPALPASSRLHDKQWQHPNNGNIDCNRRDAVLCFSQLQNNKRNDEGATVTSDDQDVPNQSEGLNDEEEKECWYQYKKGKWRRRVKLEDLKKGQMLLGTKLNQDLLKGKTGPKVFFECGVGRIDERGNWQIVNGMVRLGTRFNSKASVVRKRIARISKLEEVELFVSVMRLDNGRLELSLKPPEDDPKVSDNNEKEMVPASTLISGEERSGTVVRVEDYGVFVDVGANRNGLLHIQKVADMYGFIDKSKGLESAGLKRGARVSVCVERNEKKRLSLDFTSKDKSEAAKKMKLIKEDQKRREEVTKALQPGDECSGTVIKVEDFGVFVDVDASINGLLYIKKVANLNGSFIDKAKGLKAAGLEDGARIRVCVEKIEDGRLFLDFTPQDRLEAKEELKLKKRGGREVSDGVQVSTKVLDTTAAPVSATETEENQEVVDDDEDAAAWAEFAAAPYDDNSDDDYNYTDDDEDRGIEDALGLGSY